MTLTTWAGSHTFSGGPLLRPTSVEEVADVVAAVSRARGHVRALGSRHSFHDLADGPGTLVALDRLDLPVDLVPDDPAGPYAVAGGGVRYGELARTLHAAGWALHTMASLPHIAVARAPTRRRARSRAPSPGRGTSGCRTSGSSTPRPRAPSCRPSTLCRASMPSRRSRRCAGCAT